MAKEDIFSKLNVKDYNNELERVLEKKDFSGDVKNLLLSMLYKIEISYEDYSIVKKCVMNKNAFLEKIIVIIKEECDNIILIKPLSDQSDVLEKNNTNFMVDQNEKTIRCYPNDRILLQSLYTLEKQKITIYNKYNLIGKYLKEFLIFGKILNDVEVIRDFNGWSWSFLLKEIGNVPYNLMYQNLIILIGCDFLEEFIYNKQEIDYIKEFEKQLESHFGKELKSNFIKFFYDTLILIHIEANYQEKIDLISQIKEEHKELAMLEDKSTFFVAISEDKKRYIVEIKKIDEILSKEDLLQKEMIKQNRKLSEDKRIFNTSHLKCVLNRSKKELLSKVDRCNYLMDPKNYVRRISDLKTDLSFFTQIDLKDEKLSLDDSMIKLQKAFLDCFSYKMEHLTTKKEIIDSIYNLRYYNLLPYNENGRIGQQEQIKRAIDIIGKQLIDKACEQKVLTIFNENKSINYRIVKTILDLRIIRLEHIYFKLKLNGGIINIEIYDDEMLEQNIQLNLEEREMGFAKKFLVKQKKKIKLFI